MASKKTETGSTPDKKKSASKKASSPKAAKPRAKRATYKPSKGGGSWGRFVALEAATWLGGVALGVTIVAVVLWGRAQQDVEAFLADPSRNHPGIVYSAPMEVAVGQAASVSDLAGELLAAGYERVPKVEKPDQFSLSGERFDIWTEPLEGPGFEVTESRVAVEIDGEGRIAKVVPGDRAVLRPTVLGTVGDPEDRRSNLALDAMSPYVEQAVLAMEDSRFRDHYGVDPVGIVRALVHNARSDDGMHGGSTITQQLAKNLFLSPDRTLQRKVREVFFALAIESRLSKDEILELYLQEVYLGQSGGVPLYGVEQAARAWFGVSASSLELHEAATVAGVISAPNMYSPRRHPERAVERRDLALTRMVDMGFVDAELAEDARKEPLVVDGMLPGAHRRAPWAFDEAVERAEQAVGSGALATRGYRVYTTIQPLAQRAAERAMRDGIAEVEHDYPMTLGTEASLVAVRATDGAVIALVGGRDYAKSPFNRATNAWRQVGSCAKPIGLLAAFDADPDLTPLSRVWDTAIAREFDGKKWTPTNYDGVFHGEVSIRQGIEASYNIPSIRLAERVGFEELQSFSRTLGVTRSSHFPSAALGAYPSTAWEMAGAYTVFPGGGTVHEPYLLIGIADAEGAPLLTFAPKARDAASARATALSVSVLQGVMTSGTGARAFRYGVPEPVAGKTGTTDDYRDAWFVGFTPDVVAAVWMGRDRGDLGLAGSRAALPVWARFVAAIPAPTADEFPLPDGIVTKQACAESHWIARDACPHAYREVFPKGAVPSKQCDVHGGPVVDVKHFFGGLFERREEPPGPAEVEANDPPADTRRRRAEREDTQRQ